MTPTNILYAALALYAVGTLIALGTLFTHGRRPQLASLLVMIGGFIAHTVWIGTICARTGHPPLTNLAEITAFLGWTIFAVELALWIRYRVYAAAFFVYPLVLLLLTISAITGETFVALAPGLRSSVFTAHLLFSTLGIAGLMIGLAFSILAYAQDRSLKMKTRGPLWNWIPNLNVCRVLSYRALAIGFSVYTLGLLAGVLWSYRTTAGFMELRIKQVAAVVAWIFFAAILQSYISGSSRTRKTMVLSACAFAAIIVSMLGIDRG